MPIPDYQDLIGGYTQTAAQHLDECRPAWCGVVAIGCYECGSREGWSPPQT